MANVEFPPFTRDAASEWLGQAPAADSDLTLATLLEQQGALERIGTTATEPSPGMYL